MIGSTLGHWETPLLINSFSLVILFVLLLDSRQKNKRLKSQRYVCFQYMAILNIFLLVTDGIAWVSMNHDNATLRIVHIVATTIFYCLDPWPSFFFIRITNAALNEPADKQKRLVHWYLIPIVMHTVIALASPFTGWFFRIDEVNVYHRGSILVLSFILSFILIILAAGKVAIRYYRAIRENSEAAKNLSQYSWLVKFTVIPILGGILQFFLNKVTYVWNVSVIALLIMYINNQNNEITTDVLTGLYNRRQAFSFFERFVREREGKRENCGVAVVVLDINGFKSINDQYGHIMGDEAIVTTARTLEAEFAWDDFICRFGGDEFMVITKHASEKVLQDTVARVNDHMARFHAQGKHPFTLSVSAGYAVYTDASQTLNSLFAQADAMMLTAKGKPLQSIGNQKKGEIEG